jgi:hypothetical protein
MRYGPDDQFWVVTDPGPESTQGDILFRASLRELMRQFAGGLTMDEHPTLFTDEHEAEIEAFGRLTAMRAAQAIARSGTSKLANATRIELLDGEGKVLFESELPAIKA